MKNSFTRLKFLLLLCVLSSAVSAQKNFWTDIPQSSFQQRRDAKLPLPKKYRTLRLDTANLISALHTAPKEFTKAAKTNALLLMFPMPDGSYKRFRMIETSMMEPELAAKFPNIKTYGGQGIDDPYSTIKIDWTELGLHVMILSQLNDPVFIDPYTAGKSVDYISYNKKDVSQKTPFIENESIFDNTGLNRTSIQQRTGAAACIGGTLRRYRLAVACTAQYAQAAVGSANPTPAQALSAIVTTVNRVDGVYETELAIRMVLIGNNNQIVFTDQASQPFKGNSNPQTLINESQKVIDSIIGPANYDIGHTFSSNASSAGFAAIGVVCINGQKARGITGTANPVGDPYDIDYVAHEIGHEFGATHTFNATTGSCGISGQVDPSSNAEPGSGVTIMAYAGICNSDNNLQSNSIPYFHAVSLDQISGYVGLGTGSSCAVPIITGNNPPAVNAGNNYIIPKSTPFVLAGSATDADGDPLTYSWEQVNVGGPFGDWDHPSGDAPIFRSFAPVSSPVRYFPRLFDILNDTTTIGEILPSYARVLNFRLTARDNRAGGGGVCSDETNITVEGNAGPFIVTSPDTATTWEAGSFKTITSAVANTDKAPVSCANVAIELSTDGGLTFPVTLAANTANDGMEEIIVPNNLTSTARVRVRALGNVFFDVSNHNFSITASSENGFTFSNPQPVISCNSSTAGTVINTNALNNFSTPITLSASGNPAGTSVVFSANPINPGSNDSITLVGNIPTGIFNITITGTADSIVKSRVIQFVIGLPITVPAASSPANNSIGVALLPSFKWKPTTDAAFYTLDISTSSNFSTTVQSINHIVDSSYVLTTPLAPNTQYYWRVVPQNSCGAGPASATILFKTVAIVCADPVTSSDVPKFIDTTQGYTVISNLNIPAGGVIQDVNVVGLHGKHTAVSDLTVSLISPESTEVILFTEDCGNQDFNLNFDDEAANDIACPLDSLQTARPFQALSAFKNKNSTGTWKLKIVDGYPQDGGSLDGWGLRICTYQPSALPVNWLSFTAAKNQNKSVLLQWSTTNEINNGSYEIEKSSDGVAFTSIGQIPAGGNSTGLQQYLFNDAKPYTGNNYYRLRQVDKDGSYSFSQVVKVTFDETSNQYVVYPNPAVNTSTVRILSEMKQLTILVTDASGKQVYQRGVETVKPGETFVIPVKSFGKGLYILTLKTSKGSSNEKIIVQ